jgi:hypothetical protein
MVLKVTEIHYDLMKYQNIQYAQRDCKYTYHLKITSSICKCFLAVYCCSFNVKIPMNVLRRALGIVL